MLHIIPQILLYILYNTLYHSAVYNTFNLAMNITQHFISCCSTSFLKSCLTYNTVLYIIVLHIIPQILLHKYTALYIIVLHIIAQILLYILHSTLYHIAALHSENLAIQFYFTVLSIIVLQIIPQILFKILHSTLYHRAAHHTSNLAIHYTVPFIIVLHIILHIMYMHTYYTANLATYTTQHYIS